MGCTVSPGGCCSGTLRCPAMRNDRCRAAASSRVPVTSEFAARQYCGVGFSARSCWWWCPLLRFGGCGGPRCDGRLGRGYWCGLHLCSPRCRHRCWCLRCLDRGRRIGRRGGSLRTGTLAFLTGGAESTVLPAAQSPAGFRVLVHRRDHPPPKPGAADRDARRRFPGRSGRYQRKRCAATSTSMRCATSVDTCAARRTATRRRRLGGRGLSWPWLL